MTARLIRSTLLAPALALLCSLPAMADEPSEARFGAGDFRAGASIDYLNLFGDEQVYYTDGQLLSRLLWETTAGLGVTFDGRYGITDTVSIQGSATIGLAADSYMTDYDWLARPFYNDWTDRSRHPDTALDHYFALDIAGRYTLRQSDTSEFGLVGGLRYTDVQWTAYGGDYVYSFFTLHDSVGNFTDGERGITYRQYMPAVYGGITGSVVNGNWTFDGAAKLGATVGAHDADNHWMRDLLFTEQFGTGLYAGLEANAAYRFSNTASLKFGMRYDHYGMMTGPTVITDTITGAQTLIPGDAAGGALNAFRLSVGANVKF